MHLPFSRIIFNTLINWKNSASRKPIVLRGARQVGKTTLILQFAKTFDHQIILNLEKAADKAFFDQFEDAKVLMEALLLANNIPGKGKQNTLLFLDEIQESPKAIQMLRYFYEEIPEVCVVAAGSLLEFAMADVKSFPVGRVHFLYLYPVNFQEYLEALGHHEAIQYLQSIPVEKVAHNTLLKHFNQFAILGGMPEVIGAYCISRSLADLPPVYESIWRAYRDDIGKYATTTSQRNILRHLIDTAPLYIDQRIKFQNFGNSNYKSREIKEGFQMLERAGILKLIYPSTSIQAPIKPDFRKSPRIQLLDGGLSNHVLGIQADLLPLDDLDNSYKGALIPQLVYQEFISMQHSSDRKPSFWVREKSQSSSEVDLLLQLGQKLIPVEIKSGKAGTLRSLHEFVDRSDHPYAIRMYSGPFSIEKQKTRSGTSYLLMNLPYYLGTKLSQYASYFVESHSLNTN